MFWYWYTKMSEIVESQNTDVTIIQFAKAKPQPGANGSLQKQMPL